MFLHKPVDDVVGLGGDRRSSAARQCACEGAGSASVCLSAWAITREPESWINAQNGHFIVLRAQVRSDAFDGETVGCCVVVQNREDVSFGGRRQWTVDDGLHHSPNGSNIAFSSGARARVEI